ncbi:hypothetical protein CK203_039490 [Vitis vinifera]|uniref:Uncharacterized protein n=1 Tax=Vitis vinifera TaxID=29760 RepID=A0A438HKF3_VITVI|nr:hypothetical protein CK203_039490 [Vitis vinifera]
MVLRSLQPRIARHVVGVLFADFGSLVMALYDVEDGILRGLWTNSSPSDIKGKKPFVGPRPADVSAIGSSSQRPLRRHQQIPQFSEPHSSYASLQYKPRTPRPADDQTAAMLYYSVHRETYGTLSPTWSSAGLYSLCFEDVEIVLTDRHAVERQALRKLTEAGLLTALTPRPPPQPLPPQFRMDLHCAYHQGPGHETDRCTALRHAIQDLIDWGLVHLGQPSVTQNPLPAHTTHAVPPPTDGIHFLEFDEIDDHIHMLSDDDLDPEPIMPDVIYEMSGVTLGPRMPAPFRLVPEAASVQAATVEPLILPHYSVRTPFILILDVEEVQAPYVDDSQTLDIQYVLRGGRVMRQSPPAAARPVEGTLLASSSTHRDALIRALSQIRVETTTTPEGLIHMMTAGRATCIVFSDDDLPPEGSDHTRPLFISVGCSGRRVPFVLLDNGSALNVCPFATAIALGYAPFDFGPSTQTVRAYDNTRREVMGTLEIELLIGPATFVVVFQVLRIPTSFNLLLGRPWIHRAGAIPSSLHQKVKFIHDDRGDRGLLPRFCDHVLRSAQQHGGAGYYAEHVLSSRHGIGRRQHGPSEFIAFPDREVPFELGFIPTEADYRHMARLRRERVRARLTRTPFYYPVRPYAMSLADYFVRASEPLTHSDVIIGGLSTTQEAELQRLVQQLRLRDGALGPSTSVLIAPSSPDRTSLITLCFPDEIDDHGAFAEISDIVDRAVPHDEYIDEMLMMSSSPIEERVHPRLSSSFDLFGVSAIELADESLTAPAPEPAEDIIVFDDLIDSHVGTTKGVSDFVDSPLSFDVLSGFVSRSDIISDHSSMDFSTFEYCLCLPILSWDTEIVDFGTIDQPRELRIRSDLSVDERDSLIQLLGAYLDVFAWSYEDMPGLDPSIVQHRLPLLPHARPVK